MIRVENVFGEIVEYTGDEWEDVCVAEEIAREERLAELVAVEEDD